MARFARVYDLLHATLGASAACLFAFVALGTTADVVMRNVGLGTITGMLEYCEYALFAATFLGAPWVLKQGAHVRVDVLLGVLPVRAARRLELAANLIGIAVCCVLLYYAVSEARQAYIENQRIIKMFIVPSWQIIAVVAISLALLAVEFARRALAGGPGRDRR
jgi:TRAP-type C4-dicarboxylate transport system permease small subunit